jgi:diguanylate cyclase (GGDEF)-like protein
VDDNAAFLGFRSSNRDITERYQSQKKLEEANQRLEAQLSAIQLLQEHLRDQAIRDPLTGLFNRRYLYETLDRELARAKREHSSISVMMIDIDLFKNINDTYGHQAGDEVLITLGSLLKHGVRQSDIACRYGGEEFVLILPGVEQADAIQRAEAIRVQFSGMTIVYGKTNLAATVSTGIAFYPQHGDDSYVLINLADKAMYQAKQAGRNQVNVWH